MATLITLSALVYLGIGGATAEWLADDSEEAAGCIVLWPLIVAVTAGATAVKCLRAKQPKLPAAKVVSK